MPPSSPEANDLRARILDTAENLLRRHGLEKLNVVDVARALGMSHGNVYRHFPSKAGLRAAVIDRWLRRVSAQTRTIADRDGPADQRLIDWLRELALIKQRKVTDDVELLAAAVKIVRDAPEVQHDHGRELTSQVEHILEDGIEDGTLSAVRDAPTAATAVLNATCRFHHPEMVATGGTAAAQMEGLDGVISLIMAALKGPKP